VVVFVSIPAMVPNPLSNPVTAVVLSLVQLYVVPTTVPVKDIAVMELPEQTI
jgi:hypothetical protein